MTSIEQQEQLDVGDGRVDVDQPVVAAAGAIMDEVGSGSEFTSQLATLEPPPPEMQQLFAAMAGNQPAMDGFVSVLAGTLSPVEFFDPAHLEAVLRIPAA